MPLFRNNTVVEARQITEDLAEDIASWCGGVLVEEINPETEAKTPGINVPTTEGPSRASLGDWVLKRDGDDFWPVKGHEFLKYYEPADA
jgi:hypothetical protein